MNPTTTRMELEGIILSEISQRQRQTNTVSSLLHVESKKQNKQAVDTENRLVVARSSG